MNPNRKLFRVLHRISVLVAADEPLWADLGALIREFGVKSDEPESMTTEPEANAQSSSETTTAHDVVGHDSCPKTIMPEQVANPSEPGVAAELARSKPTTQEHQRCVRHELVARCKLKSEGSLWGNERLRLKEIGADHLSEIAPRDRNLIERAKSLTDCFLWMNCASAPIPKEISLYATLGGCFEALAAVLMIAANREETLADDNGLFEQLLMLVAEAQSAVREAVRRVGGPTDQDQTEAYRWVRSAAAEHRVYIERYLREEDRADPTSWKDLLERINSFAHQIEQRTAAIRIRRRLFQKLQYQLGQALSYDADHHWQSVASTVDVLVQDGLPPSNVEIRNLLLPHLDIIPAFDKPPQSFELVLRELKRFQESIVEEPIVEGTAEICPQVEAAAELIQGRAVVLIGGDARSGPKDALEQALHLSELIWVPTKHGQPVSTFEQFIARPEVAVVALAIRWASHAFTDIRHICRKHGVPLVRLPSGYSPNQVAMQIVNQCGWRLKQAKLNTSSLMSDDRP